MISKNVFFSGFFDLLLRRIRFLKKVTREPARSYNYRIDIQYQYGCQVQCTMWQNPVHGGSIEQKEKDMI